MIADTENTVAFKALGNDGFGTDVTGVLTDDIGEELLKFNSLHLGMGQFSFTPEPNRIYKVTTTSNGVKKVSTLPAVNNNGHILSVSQTPANIYIFIKSSVLNSESFSVIGQSLQTVNYAVQGVLDVKEARITVPKEKFPTGIAQFTLFINNVPVSERLVFIDKKDELNIQITPDKEKYNDREKATALIHVTDRFGKPVQGSFSLSVTDDKVITPSIERINIKGSLLLDSDLKGYIENPGWYFAGNEPMRKEALDILLLTQGWSRFSWETIKDNPLPTYSVEDEFKITGRLVNVLGKPIENGTVLLHSNVKTDIPATAVTDNDGRFGFFGFNNPDTTVLALQGRNKKDKRAFMDIKLDEQDNKSVLSSVPMTRFSSSELSEERPSVDFIEQAVLQNKYDENIWTIDLPEIEILDNKTKQKKRDLASRNMFSRKLNRDDINDKNTVMQEMRRLGKEPAFIVLDGFRIDSIDSRKDPTWKIYLETTLASNFESIELVSRTGVSMWGSMGEVYNPTKGIFILKSRSPEDMMSSGGSNIPTPGLIVYKTEGYSVRKEFYVPDYNNPEVRNNRTPDLRTTIYWNPVIKTDSEGKAIVEFFTADNVRTYSYVLEGIGENKTGYQFIQR